MAYVPALPYDAAKDVHEHDNYRRSHELDNGPGNCAKLRQQLDEMCAAKHSYSERVYKQAHQEQIRRLRSGQICYHHCSEQDLQMFIDQRKKDLLRQKSVSPYVNLSSDKDKALMVWTLQAGDDTRPFHYFLQLPAELRNIIHALYLAPLTEYPLHAPTWPPLARVKPAAARRSHGLIPA